MGIAEILALVNALTPLVAPTVVSVEHVMGALRGAGAISDPQADADLRALVIKAIAAKAEADRAAAGDDPR